MTKTISISLVIILVAAWGLYSSHSMEDAQKMDRLLTRIAQDSRERVVLRSVEFTQTELNAYLNLIYLPKYAPEVEFVDLVLENNNTVSGSMAVKLEGEEYERLPSFLRDFEVRFSGRLESKNQRMRYIFSDIRINGTRFAPEVLDEAFSSAQAGVDIKQSIFDWFTLLPGLKKVAVESGRITLFF
ncbi:MAG TPA: hypothetical protein ENN40_05985 [Candidatus Aminicenantes bacterium]|nr:hypothetical protein [Candidatus Aminicenantes bacterium]